MNSFTAWVIFGHSCLIGIALGWNINLQRQVNQCRRIIQQRTSATVNIALRAHDRIDDLIPGHEEGENI